MRVVSSGVPEVGGCEGSLEECSVLVATPHALNWSMGPGDIEARGLVVAEVMVFWRGKPIWWGCPTYAALLGEVGQELCLEPPSCLRPRNGGHLRTCPVATRFGAGGGVGAATSSKGSALRMGGFAEL